MKYSIKNKKGSSLFVMLMLGVTFIVLALALAPALNNTVNESMNTVELNCSSVTITNQEKAECTSMDMQKLYIGIVLGLAGILLVAGVR